MADDQEMQVPSDSAWQPPSRLAQGNERFVSGDVKQERRQITRNVAAIAEEIAQCRVAERAAWETYTHHSQRIQELQVELEQAALCG